MNSKVHARRSGGPLTVVPVPASESDDPRHAEVQIPVDGVTIEAELTIPRSATGIVVFAHASGSGRHSPCNRFAAWIFQCAGLGTLLLDLLTRQEELDDTLDGHLRFDVKMLARRLIAATVWLATDDFTQKLKVGYFAAGTAAAASIIAASRLGPAVAAIVSRGGRLDLASAELAAVVAPTLLIVGGRDDVVLDLNRNACAQLSCEKRLEIVPSATNLFAEQGALNTVAALASDWFRRTLAPSCAQPQVSAAQP